MTKHTVKLTKTDFETVSETLNEQREIDKLIQDLTAQLKEAQVAKQVCAGKIQGAMTIISRNIGFDLDHRVELSADMTEVSGVLLEKSID